MLTAHSEWVVWQQCVGGYTYKRGTIFFYLKHIMQNKNAMNKESLMGFRMFYFMGASLLLVRHHQSKHERVTIGHHWTWSRLITKKRKFTIFVVHPVNSTQTPIPPMIGMNQNYNNAFFTPFTAKRIARCSKNFSHKALFCHRLLLSVWIE